MPLDHKLRRIIYWTWPFVMLLAGLGLGAALEYNHINSVVDSYSRKATAANCLQLKTGRVEGRARAAAVITLKQAMIKFSGDAADRRAESIIPADQKLAGDYLVVKAKVEKIKIKQLPLIQCVNGKATPIPEKGNR